MAIQVWNTLTRRKEGLEPLTAMGLKMFVCGPTVYDASHLGHAKTYTQFDLVARHLRSRGFRLEYVQNITDIDDKIIARAAELGISSKQLARQQEALFLEDMRALGNCSVNRYARATDFIDQIVSQIVRLLEKGHAYQLPDGFYYDIETFPEYGKLAGRRNLAPDDAVSRVDENPLKRHPGDFALWKNRRPGEPYWTTSLGEGRPGWHIEDTAITETLFGPQYDIHGGAVDLIFPHHEAEIAQMEGISGRAPLARYWMHTGFLTMRTTKMSKSLGNFVTIRDVLQSVEPRVLRFFLLSHHYRSPIEYDSEMLQSAAASLKRVENFALRLPVEASGESAPSVEDTREAMLAALDDDFNTPEALGVLFSFVREQNRRQRPEAGAARLMQEFNAIFGVLPAVQHEGLSDASVQEEVDRRERMRAERRFAEADEIRERLKKIYVVVEDTPTGARWHRNSGDV